MLQQINRICDEVEPAKTHMIELFVTSSHSALRHLQCECEEETLILRGRLPSYYLKQLALAAVRRYAAGMRISDCTEVHYESCRPLQNE